MIHEQLGGNVGIEYLAGPCVFDGVDDEGVTAMSSGLVKFEIVPQQFVDGLGAGEENGSGVVADDWVDEGMCGRGKHLVVLRFGGRFVG